MTTLDDVVSLALQLSQIERARLIERIVATLVDPAG